jgi:hypothetical protein
MKKVVFFPILVFLIGFPSFFAVAQDRDRDEMAGRYRGFGYSPGPGHGMMMDGDMMDGGMMGMMGGGMGFGFGMGFGMGMTGFDPFEWLKTELQLSDQQVSRLRGFWLEFVRASAPARADLQVAGAEIQNLLSARTVSMTQVENRIREMAEVWADLQLAQTRLLVQAKGVFTPDQLQRLRSLMGPGARGRMPGYDSRFEDEGEDQQGAIPPQRGPGMMRPQQ